MSTLAVTPLASKPNFRSVHAVNEQAAAKTLGQLISDVQAGNLARAQADLASLTQQLGSSANGDATSPLAKLLAQLVVELGSGDLSDAQASVGSFLTALSGVATPAASASEHREPNRQRDGNGAASSTAPASELASLSRGTGTSAATI